MLDDPAAHSLSIESVNREALRPRDRELLSAVTASLTAIHAWPDLTHRARRRRRRGDRPVHA
jgi:hypothetical protein